MTTADLRLTSDQETALRESTETGRYYPQTLIDHRIAAYFREVGFFVYQPDDRCYLITAAGRDWLALHPTEVAR